MSARLHQHSRVPGMPDSRAGRISPLSLIPNMLQWYDPDQISGAAVGDHLDTWLDSSGNGWDLAKSTGTGPVYHPTDFNGHAQVAFASTPMAAAARVVPLTELTIICVLKVWGSGRPIGLENSGGGNDGIAMYDGNLWVIRNSGATGDLVLGGVGPGVFTLQLGAAGARSTKNGVQVQTGGATAWTSNGQAFHLGSAGTNDLRATCTCGDFLTFSRRLTNTEVDGAAVPYLMAKYGIV